MVMSFELVSGMWLAIGMENPFLPIPKSSVVDPVRLSTTTTMTDNPNLLLQDCNRKLFKWFASRIDSRHSVRKALDML